MFMCRGCLVLPSQQYGNISDGALGRGYILECPSHRLMWAMTAFGGSHQQKAAWNRCLNMRKGWAVADGLGFLLWAPEMLTSGWWAQPAGHPVMTHEPSCPIKIITQIPEACLEMCHWTDDSPSTGMASALWSVKFLCVEAQSPLTSLVISINIDIFRWACLIPWLWSILAWSHIADLILTKYCPAAKQIWRFPSLRLSRLKSCNVLPRGNPLVFAFDLRLHMCSNTDSHNVSAFSALCSSRHAPAMESQQAVKYHVSSMCMALSCLL